MVWIRSQGKQKLIHVKEFWLAETVLYATGHGGSEDDGMIIGSFPTQEAALEELDRIQDWISLQNAVGVYQVSQAEY